jgi:hypothetical protein
MPKKLKPLPLRQSNDGKWEVKMESRNCDKCKTKKDADILPNALKVRLWTWQNRKFDITDPKTRVETKSNSKYLDASCNPGYNVRHLKAYERLWGLLEDDQFHWYHIDWEDAINGSNDEEKKGNVLWELDIPKNRVFRKICNMAWHYIVSDGNTCPAIILWNHLSVQVAQSFTKDLNQYWKNMKPQQLWDRLFVEFWGQPCYQVLVRHPVDTSWLTKDKDPRKDIDWWHKLQ